MRPHWGTFEHWRLETLAAKEIGNSSFWSLSLLLLLRDSLWAICSTVFSHNVLIKSETQYKWHHLTDSNLQTYESKLPFLYNSLLHAIGHCIGNPIICCMIAWDGSPLCRLGRGGQCSEYIPQKCSSHVPNITFLMRWGETTLTIVWSEVQRQEKKVKIKGLAN